MASSRTADQGARKLQLARQEFASGRFAVAAGDASGEALLRSALASYWSAMNWLEGTPQFEVAHAELHVAGRFARETFREGCRFVEEPDGSFAQRCPVALAHKRFGVSIGATGNAICSICGDDASECPHMPGREYDMVARRQRGRCNICHEVGCRHHRVGETYGAEAHVVVTRADLHEVSIVARPAQPDARITKIPIARERIEASLGRLPQGAHVSCDKCLSSCSGFDYLPEE